MAQFYEIFEPCFIKKKSLPGPTVVRISEEFVFSQIYLKGNFNILNNAYHFDAGS